MNEKLSTQEIEEIALSLESQWLPLAHIAASNPPAWKHVEETINTQTDSIHGQEK